jgi:hypothetical protein
MGAEFKADLPALTRVMEQVLGRHGGSFDALARRAEAGLVSAVHHPWGPGPHGTPASSVHVSCPAIPRMRP